MTFSLMNKDKIVEAFANTLIELRKEKGLSQEKLANLSDLDRSNISRLERGHYAPTVITLYQIAEAFDLNPIDILGRINEKIKD